MTSFREGVVVDIPVLARWMKTMTTKRKRSRKTKMKMKEAMAID